MDQTRDFRDLQDELAGRETGRLRRFGHERGEEPDLRDRKRRQENEAARLALDIQRLQIEERLREMRDRASHDALGRAVFRAADGRAYYEDGTELTPEEIDAIEWIEGAPTWEEYRDAAAALRAANRRTAAEEYAGPTFPALPPLRQAFAAATADERPDAAPVLNLDFDV